MTLTTDQRLAAASKIDELTQRLKAHAAGAEAEGARRELLALVDECEALARAVAAFHLEGIRFRMFNVDRLLDGVGAAAPPEAHEVLQAARRHLEAAGFYTRSHQAPA